MQQGKGYNNIRLISTHHMALLLLMLRFLAVVRITKVVDRLLGAGLGFLGDVLINKGY